jgi:hypothetical protein
MTTDNTTEYQHAEATILVAFPVAEDLTEKQRKQKLRDLLKRSEYTDGLEFRTILHGETVLTFTESSEEAAERHCAEAEIEHEARQQRRLERHWDENGYF